MAEPVLLLGINIVFRIAALIASVIALCLTVLLSTHGKTYGLSYVAVSTIRNELWKGADRQEVDHRLSFQYSTVLRFVQQAKRTRATATDTPRPRQPDSRWTRTNQRHRLCDLVDQ